MTDVTSKPSTSEQAQSILSVVDNALDVVNLALETNRNTKNNDSELSDIQKWCLKNSIPSPTFCNILAENGYKSIAQLTQCKSSAIIDFLSSAAIKSLADSVNIQILFLKALLALKKPLFDKMQDNAMIQKEKNSSIWLRSLARPMAYNCADDDDESEDESSDDDGESEDESSDEDFDSCYERKEVDDCDNKEDDTIGFSVGGAKDVNTFRDNILQGYMPSKKSITFNGLFYEYFFDTKTNRRSLLNEGGNDSNNDPQLFYPSYCYARVFQPCPVIIKLNEGWYDNTLNAECEQKPTKMSVAEVEHYLTIGLNSNIKQKDFKRFKLNLVIVLDQSGSMGSAFDGKYGNYNSGGANKMTVANNSVIALLKHLTDDDRFGFLSFDTQSYVHQKLQFMKDINRENLEQKIRCIRQKGGTDFEVGYKSAISLYDKLWKHLKTVNEGYENRIIFLTDACPNAGNTDPNSLLAMVKKNSEMPVSIDRRIYTTFIGVGLDFNSSLIQEISQTRGCNYYAVHSSEEFVNRMDEEFSFMVTPLVFNVSLEIRSEGNSAVIADVFGSSAKKSKAMINSGEIRKIHTLFPAKKSKVKGGIKGGIVLLKLQTNSGNTNGNGTNENSSQNYNLRMHVKYEDRNGLKYDNNQIICLDVNVSEGIVDQFSGSYYDNTGVRKGILLKNYVQLMQHWIESEKSDNNYGSKRELQVSEKWKVIWKEFSVYFEEEMIKCEDDDMRKEIYLMNTLVSYNSDIANLFRVLIQYDGIDYDLL